MASPIISRWEWRTFGDSFGPAAAALRQWASTGESQGDERYLLTTDGDNVKIRDELLDIKVLREVDERGLERWEPSLKAGFPLDARTLVATFDALRRPLPVLSRDEYSQEQLLSELIEPTDSIRISHVHKRRARYMLGDCMGELSDLEVDGRQIHTLALESVDPAAVVAQLGALGLEDRVNISVPRALLQV
jgi:exopolyphosphatase/guanosine-5'-triphosphate,3'-diphosphate pyrophosphatase